MVTGAWLVAFVFLLAGAFYLSRLARQEAEEIFIQPMRWLLTAAAIVLVIVAVRHAEALGLFVVLGVALVLSWIWLPTVVGVLLSPLFDALTGGKDEVDPAPFYHRAAALRKKGQYDLAVQEVQRQLAQFPDDFDGMMMLAEIQSDDLKDIPGALGTLMEIASTESRADRDRILALNRVADLELRRQDREAAATALRRIVEGFPGTDSARFAEQRLVHMPNDAAMAARRETPTVAMPDPSAPPSLKASHPHGDPALATPAERVSGMLATLREHPSDWETRQQLAQLYADSFRRFDLAAAELETLITTPNQPDRAVVGWLNNLADVHLRNPDGLPAANATLQRIVDRFPGSAWAEAARSRLARLGFAARAREIPKTIKLGNYEQNIGLKPDFKPPRQ